MASNAGLWSLIWCYPKQVVEQTVDLSSTVSMIVLMKAQSNDVLILRVDLCIKPCLWSIDSCEAQQLGTEVLLPYCYHGSTLLPCHYPSGAEAPFSQSPCHGPCIQLHHRYRYLLGPHGCPTAYHLPGTGSHRLDHHGLRRHRGWHRVCWICHGVPTLWLLLLVSGDILWARHWLSAVVDVLSYIEAGKWCHQMLTCSNVSQDIKDLYSSNDIYWLRISSWVSWTSSQILPTSYDFRQELFKSAQCSCPSGTKKLFHF